MTDESTDRRMLRAREAMDRDFADRAKRPYGIDCALRDPSGNHIRLTGTRGWDE